MKLSLSRSLFALWLALLLTIAPSLAVGAEPSTSASKPADPAPTAVAPDAKQPEPPPPATAAPAAPEKSASDQAVAVEPAGDAKVAPEPSEKVEPAPAPSPKDQKHKSHAIDGPRRRHRGDNARVRFFSDSTLEADGEADAVVSIAGSSTSEGHVSDAVVSIFGSSTSSGEVGGAVVSVFGSTRVTAGTVGDTAVSVLGNTYINGHVHGQVVAVLGNVEFGPDAEVEGEVVCVGGNVIRDPKAILRGGVQNVGVGDRGVNFAWLTTWVTKCLLYGRPLAFDSHLIWAWGVALAYLVVYLLISLLAPDTLTKCISTLEQRPGKSIVAGLLTMVLTPLVYVLLTLTVFIAVGVALIPLFTLGLFLAGLFGRVVMLAWLGSRILRISDADKKGPAVLSVALGGVIVLLLYTVPIIGFVTYKAIGILGLGVVVYTMMLSSKDNRAATARAATAATVAVPSPVPVIVPPVSDFSTPTPVPPVNTLPPVISAATLPRAGFWLRIGASLLDVIMVAVLFGMLNSVFHWFLRVNGSFPFWFAVYHIVMWATKGTTVGGIICGLKVVRLDDRPIDWGVAIVRGLGAFLSLVVGGLGFIWVVFDDEKQSWHDKIAGTTIVQVPKGTSLV